MNDPVTSGDILSALVAFFMAIVLLYVWTLPVRPKKKDNEKS